MHNNFMNSLSIRRCLAHGLLFALPCLCLVTRWGVGLCSFLFLLAGLLYFRQAWPALARHWKALRWVLAAFLCHFLLALLLLLLRPDAVLGSLEKPLRMFLASSALVLVLAARPSPASLEWGVAGGALGGALLVGYQRVVLGIERPGALVNAITAGDLLMCLGLLALVCLADARRLRQAAVPAVGVLAGIGGAVLTGTRGSALALVLALPVLLRYGRSLNGRWLRPLLGATLVLAAAVCLVPQTGVQERARQALRDVTTYMEGGSVYSQVGIRLELWRAAALLVAERPLAGAGPGVVRAELAAYVGDGALAAEVLAPVHFHNDALQALVSGGVVGLLAWLSTLLAPLLFFARALRSGHAGPAAAPAMAGLLLVLAYFAFGLTEVIFWSVRASLFYALMVFVLMGLCLNAAAPGRSGATGPHCARMLP